MSLGLRICYVSGHIIVPQTVIIMIKLQSIHDSTIYSSPGGKGLWVWSHSGLTPGQPI